MKSAGLPRRIDHLGRIVIPAELRRLLGINEGDYIQFSAEDGRVVIDKLEERCTFCGASTDLTQFRSKLVCAGCKAELGAGATGE
jgi:AbrB family transcriptional regulator, transcriptional pleiotropic regulator of transition state genes